MLIVYLKKQRVLKYERLHHKMCDENYDIKISKSFMAVSMTIYTSTDLPGVGTGTFQSFYCNSESYSDKGRSSKI
jgi:hypothetical protein